MKLQRTKSAVQESAAFVYSNSKLLERLKKIPFTIASKKMKYLGISLTKEVKDPYAENRKTLKKESENTNKW